MSPSARALGWVTLAGLLFYGLFHNEVNGLNYLLWCLGLLAVAHRVHPHLRRTALGRAATALVVFTCGGYFWLDTDLAFSASLGALWLLAGTCYAPKTPTSSGPRAERPSSSWPKTTPRAAVGSAGAQGGHRPTETSNRR